ncbi:uncharacterized protein LOC134666783 [Cydia fagiglandana]|uniref:uncharacterized protein LOC134666783 n=1 Tax=Cydia fagiglandana TaxID=1458189 RepID=UPI002FEDF473
MFKVPEWSTDVPDTSVNFSKFANNKKGKKSSTPVTKEPSVKPVPPVNGNIKKKTTSKKSTDKRKLKKIRQKNRQIYQTLSKPQNIESKASSNNNQPGRFVLNPNKPEPKENELKPVNTNKHNGVNKKHDKLKKPKLNKSPKQKNKNQKAFTMSNETNGTEKKPQKRKHNKDLEISDIELNNVDTDKADEAINNAKKKKLSETFKNEDQEDILFGEKPKVKFDKKKEQIKKMLEQSNRNSINVSGNSNSLRERMIAKLQAAQFRYLNEKLYTSSGTEAKELFQADPAAFETYHQGYQQQIKKWPVNPLDLIVKRIMKMPKTHLIADMGCGSAALSRRIPQKVRSFDLVASSPGIEACDMARTPLLSASVDVVVYCLALMGTQLAEYLAEGNRVLKTGGHLLIAEVESRFDKLEDFTRGVERLGFKLLKTDQSHKVFYFLEFKKIQEASKKARHVPLTLKPCLYKRR